MPAAVDPEVCRSGDWFRDRYSGRPCAGAARLRLCCSGGELPHARMVSYRSQVHVYYDSVFASYLATDRRAEFQELCVLGYGLDAITALCALVVGPAEAVGGYPNFSSTTRTRLWTVAYAGSLPFVSLGGTSWAILASPPPVPMTELPRVETRAIVFALALLLIFADLGRIGLMVASAAKRPWVELLCSGFQPRDQA